ncbi:hypothetical protein KCU98_g197, partial [Aureobasidium melanogenum]
LKHTIGCDREYGDKQQAIITKRAAWDEDWHLEDLCESFSAPCTSVSVPPRFGFVSVCTSISQVRIRVRRLDACLHDLEVGLVFACCSRTLSSAANSLDLAAEAGALQRYSP